MAVGPHRLVYTLCLDVQVGHDVARAILIILHPKQILIHLMGIMVMQSLILVSRGVWLDLEQKTSHIQIRRQRVIQEYPPPT